MRRERHIVQLIGKLMVNVSQSVVSKSFYYSLHHYSLSDSQICHNASVVGKK